MKLNIDLALELFNLELSFWEGKLCRYEFSLFTFWGAEEVSSLFKIQGAPGFRFFDIFYLNAIKHWLRGM